MAKVSFNESLCKGCGLCAEACPKKILAVSKTVSNDKGYFVIECNDMASCIGCPDCVITVER